MPHPNKFRKKTITDPVAMSNYFNNYFSTIAYKTKSNTRFSQTHYSDYLSSTNTNTSTLIIPDKNEISFRISSLPTHKLSGRSNILVKILNFK